MTAPTLTLPGVTDITATSARPFVTLTYTDPELILHMETTTASETITLPMTTDVNVDIDWGDGSDIETFTTNSPSHEYATADTYYIKVTGSCGRFAFSNGGDKLKLLAVLNGGTDFTAGSWDGGFWGCTNLATADFKGLDTSSVTIMRDMFFACTGLTTLNVSGFDTAKVTHMENMFRNCYILTSDPGIHAFNVTSLTTATGMCQSSNAMLSTAEYNTILVNWEAQAVKNSVGANFGDATHSGDGSTARAALVLPVIDGGHGWVIGDGGSA